MVQILLLLLSLFIIIIGWSFKKNLDALEVTFSSDNHQNLKITSTTLLVIGVLGLILGIIIPTKVVALFYVSLCLIVSAISSVRLAKKMK